MLNIIGSKCKQMKKNPKIIKCSLKFHAIHAIIRYSNYSLFYLVLKITKIYIKLTKIQKYFFASFVNILSSHAIISSKVLSNSLLWGLHALINSLFLINKRMSLKYSIRRYFSEGQGSISLFKDNLWDFLPQNIS